MDELNSLKKSPTWGPVAETRTFGGAGECRFTWTLRPGPSVRESPGSHVW